MYVQAVLTHFVYVGKLQKSFFRGSTTKAH